MISKHLYPTNIVKTRALQLAEEQLDSIERLREAIKQLSKNEADSQRLYRQTVELAKKAGAPSTASQLSSMQDQKVRNEQTLRSISDDLSRQQDRLDDTIVRELRILAEEQKRKEIEQRRRK